MCAVDLISDNLAKVRDLIHDASESWFNLGSELGLKQTTLLFIETNNFDVWSRFQTMLFEWLKINPPPTWEALIAALKKDSVGLSNVAKIVEKECGAVDSELAHSGAGSQTNKLFY